MRYFLEFTVVVIVFFGCLDRSPQPNHSAILDTNLTLTEKFTTIAQSHLGKPYKPGEKGPDSFDCSGFVYGVAEAVGIKLPRTSLGQSEIEGKKLAREELRVGDLVFFDTSLKGKVNHSGIYLGKDQFIHASSGKAYSVTISDMNGWYQDKFKWGKRLKSQ